MTWLDFCLFTNGLNLKPLWYQTRIVPLSHRQWGHYGVSIEHWFEIQCYIKPCSNFYIFSILMLWIKPYLIFFCIFHMLVFYQILCVIGFRFRPIFIQDLLPIVIFMLVTKNLILIQNNFYYGYHLMFYIHQCKGLCFGNLRGMLFVIIERAPFIFPRL